MSRPHTSPVISLDDLRRAASAVRRRAPFAEVQRRGALQGWKCAMCGNMFDGPFQIDHVIPFCLVGEDTLLRAICGSCHDYKTRVEAAAIARTRSTLEAVAREHPTFAVCHLCGAVVSTHFASGHPCRIDVSSPYDHLSPDWRPPQPEGTKRGK